MAEINSTAQAASALTGVSDVLSPVFTLWYLQKNITTDIAPYVTRVTYSDNIKSESDTIEVELDDTDGRWLDKWYPGKGDTLTLKMGYQGEKLLSCGTFSIDEIEVSSPASVVAIRGVATSVNNALRTKSSRGFESTTLAAIAGRIAKKHQLKLVGSIESIKIDRVTQYAETDVGFLRRLASEYGYAVKVVSDQLIFSHLATLRGQEPVKQLKPQDVASFSLRDTINRVYKSAKVKHQKSSDKKLIVYEADGGTSESDKQTKGGKVTSADSLKVNSRVSDPDSARIKADSALARHNEYQQNGSLTLMGTPQLTAGNKIELVGFGQLSGPWLITTARHAFYRNSGYITELEVARGPVTQGKAKKGKKTGKTQTLTVYKTGRQHLHGNKGEEIMAGVTRQVGTVSAVDADKVQARVRLPECDNLRTNWLNVLQRNTQDNKDYWLPDVGEQVEVLLDANGEDGVILGAVYSDVDKPPFSDKNVRGTKYADGAEFSYNRATHTLTVKGGIERVVIEVAVGITLKGKTIDLTADTTTVNGNLEINGNAHSTGSMLSDGQNSNHHSH